MKTHLKSTLLFIIGLCLTGCNTLFYQPSRQEFFTPDKFKLLYKDISFFSDDGTNLHGWLIYPPSNKKIKGTIIQFHGNAENISTHFLSLAWLVKYNYQLFIFDYRGYGKSKGFPQPKGIYQDSLAALSTALRIHKESSGKHFIVYSQSLGGTIALRALSDFKEQKHISLFVADSTFCSYQKLAFDKLSDNWITFLFSPLAYLLVSDKYEACSSIKSLKSPFLVIHGEEDTIIPKKFGKEIYNKITSTKWFWMIKDGQHINIFNPHNKENRKKFVNFLNNLQPSHKQLF